MSLLSDVRHTIRHLRQAPGFTIATVLTFAVAIGSNSAIFSAVNTVLLRPLPVTAPEQLAVIWQTDRGGQAVVELTHRHLREWMESGSTFTHAALMGSHNWAGAPGPRGTHACLVQWRLWDILRHSRCGTLLGRTLRREDDVPNGLAIAVLNHGTWVRRFGSDPQAVGSRMMLDGQAVEIVGVMPPGVDFPRGAVAIDDVVVRAVCGARVRTVGIGLGRARGARRRTAAARVRDSFGPRCLARGHPA